MTQTGLNKPDSQGGKLDMEEYLEQLKQAFPFVSFGNGNGTGKWEVEGAGETIFGGCSEGLSPELVFHDGKGGTQIVKSGSNYIFLSEDEIGDITFDEAQNWFMKFIMFSLIGELPPLPDFIKSTH